VNTTANFFFNICSCSDRFIRQLEMREAQFPEQPVTIFLNLKRCGWVEYRFTDPDNYGSEWTYYFYYTFPFATYPTPFATYPFSYRQFSIHRLASEHITPRRSFRLIDRYHPDWGSNVVFGRGMGLSSQRKVLRSPTATRKHDCKRIIFSTLSFLGC
jgi:hypothetical protein